MNIKKRILQYLAILTLCFLSAYSICMTKQQQASIFIENKTNTPIKLKELKTYPGYAIKKPKCTTYTIFSKTSVEIPEKDNRYQYDLFMSIKDEDYYMGSINKPGSYSIEITSKKTDSPLQTELEIRYDKEWRRGGGYIVCGICFIEEDDRYNIYYRFKTIPYQGLYNKFPGEFWREDGIEIPLGDNND